MRDRKPDAGTTDRVVVGLLGIAAVLLLTNLENGYLWQDEAETAVVARYTLQAGYPRGTDGRNTIEIPPFGLGPGGAWSYHPWLTFYLLAGVFALLGESTWTARLPSAALGLASLCLTWRLARRVSPDPRIHRLSLALLTCSVPFLLHMRQCRYYALTTALLLGVCLAAMAWLSQPTIRRTATLGLLLVALFHSNLGTFIPAFIAVAVAQVAWGGGVARKPFWVMMGLVLGLTLPWACLSYRPAFLGGPSWHRLVDHAEYYVRITNKYLVPLGLIAVVSAGRWLTRRRPWLGPQESLPPPRRRFLILMVVAQALFLLVPDQRHMRYLIPTLPLLVIGEAWWLTGWWRRNRLIGGGVIALVLFTSVFQSFPPRILLADFLYELTHRYTGPMEGVVDYLRAHGRPGDTVKIPYDDRTLMFYTDMTVERPSQFLEETSPTWIVLRRGRLPEAFFVGDYFRRIQATYERIEVDAPDLYWQNREDPGEHQFRTVSDAPRVVIYRKRESAHGES